MKILKDVKKKEFNAMSDKKKEKILVEAMKHLMQRNDELTAILGSRRPMMVISSKGAVG